MRTLRVTICAATLLVVAISLAGCSSSPNEDLIFAAEHGDLAGIQSALAAKADVNALNGFGFFPLERASRGCDMKVVTALLGAGADVNRKSIHVEHEVVGGGTALMAAAIGDHPGCAEVAKTLIAAGADVNAQDEYGSTALSEAAVAGHPETAKVLLDAGADANAGTPTPLALASVDGPEARQGRAEVAQLLREHGGHT